MEKEIIILSVTVQQSSVFLADEQRLNVAITRARRHLIIVSQLDKLPSLSPAFEKLKSLAQDLEGGICSNIACFIPEPL